MSSITFIWPMVIFQILNHQSDSYFTNFSLPENYNKEVMPTGKRPFVTEMGIEIRRIVNVKEFDHIMSVDIISRRYWTEARLQVSTALQKDQRYSLGPLDYEKFWKPNIHMRSLVGYTTVQGSEAEFFFLLEFGNKLSYFERGYMDFSCDFDFQLYPMDMQACVMEFLIPTAKVEEQTLMWDPEDRPSVQFYEKLPGEEVRLPKYRAKLIVCQRSYTTAYIPGNVSTVRIWILLRRELGYYVLESYVPTGLFVVLSWGSFVISADVVPGRVVLLVTNLLSLVTLFESTRELTPPGLGVKAIEVWILTCISFVVLALLEYLYILYSMKQEVTTARSCKVSAHPPGVLPELGRRAAYQGNVTSTRNMSKIIKTTVRKCSSKLVQMCLPRQKRSWCFLDRLCVVLFPTGFIIFNLAYWSVVKYKQTAISDAIYCP